MSVLSSTNSGANKKLTIELLRSLGWDYPCIIEPIIDHSKLIRDEKHKNECLYIDRRTVGNPERDYWFYATFYKETDKDCDVNYDITVYPSNIIELLEIEKYWDKVRKHPVDPLEAFKDCKFCAITAIRKEKINYHQLKK